MSNEKQHRGIGNTSPLQAEHNKGIREDTFVRGDLVMVYQKNTSKLQARWRGPFIISGPGGTHGRSYALQQFSDRGFRGSFHGNPSETLHTSLRTFWASPEDAFKPQPPSETYDTPGNGKEKVTAPQLTRQSRYLSYKSISITYTGVFDYGPSITEKLRSNRNIIKKTLLRAPSE